MVSSSLRDDSSSNTRAVAALADARAVWLLEAVACLVLLVATFAFRDLPLVDLPQHALAISSWLHLGDPATSVFRTDELELNLRTPYLLGYALARWLAPWLGVVAALKLVVWLSVVGQVAAFQDLCRRLGHDAWLGLLGLPLALGYAFCFGFVSFLAALPLLYVALALAFDQRREPTLRRGVLLGLTLCATLVAHGFVIALAMLAVAPVLVLTRGKFWLRVLPLACPLLLAAVWILPSRTVERVGGDLWDLSLARLVDLPGLLVGISSRDRAAAVCGLALIALALFSVGLPRPGIRNWPLLLPLLLACVGYMGFPTLFRGMGPLAPRFTVLLVPGLLLACAPAARTSSLQLLVRRASTAALSVGWLALFVVRLFEFNRETVPLHQLLDRLPPALSVRPLIFEREGRAFPANPAFLHLVAYYSVEKGGSPGYSFAMYPLSVIRNKPGVPPLMPNAAEWFPERFDVFNEAPFYDYFIVRSALDRSEQLFSGAEPPIVLDRRVGDFWGYRRVASR